MPPAPPDRGQAVRRINPPPRRGGRWLLLLVLLLLGGGGAYYYLSHQQDQLVLTRAATPTPAPTPTPETPTPTPMPTAAEPTPEVRATPEPLPALASLTKQQLPLRVALTKPVTIPLMFNGQRAGELKVPVGAMVQLVEVRSETQLDVRYEESTFSLPPASTDIYDRVRQLGRYTFNANTSTATATTPTATPPKLVFAKPSPSGPPRPAVKLGPGTLLSYDFEKDAWPGTTAGAFGTIDEAGSKQPSTGLRGTPNITSGLLPVHCHESDLGKVTLAFNLSASAAKPVTVRIESFSDTQMRTGGLETLIYPAAPGFYQRYAVEMSTCKPFGKGQFDPKTAYVCFSFSLEGAPWQGNDKQEISLDNVHYAVPSYYVSPKGRDSNDGHTVASAFETPQKALDAAEPGDIIVLMDGVYDGGTRAVANFKRGGVPAAWITLKNGTGQKPTLSTNGWNTISIGEGSKSNEATGPALAYIEVRGLHVHGEGEVAKEKYPEAMGKSDPRTNGNGIAVDGRYCKNIPHHLRFADNLVEYCPGCGIGTIDADWVTVENNVCRGNCWTTIYAPSGISVMGPRNFDAVENIYKRLVRNNTTNRNETFVPWEKIHRMSDGNGIILDVNMDSDEHPGVAYIGRTLVQSNLSFDNGGSGIHAFRASRVDIINNTTYLNSASKSLEYGQIFSHVGQDVRIMNNILVAPVADERAGEKPEPVNGGHDKKDTTVFSNNVYFGGNTPPIMGSGDRVADPQFVNPSRDAKVADFHLKPNSPALKEGLSHPFGPFLDLDGKPRAAPPDAGAYQRQSGEAGKP